MTTATNPEFVITRVFDAPRDLVWRAWSESSRLAQWWGPKGFDLSVLKHDFRPGGTFHFKMGAPDGNIMYGLFTYREIVAQERLVYINSFSDPEGNPARAPFSPLWPMETLTTATFTGDGGKTTLILRAVPINATGEELDLFRDNHSSMQGGYGGTWDKLDQYLAGAGKEKS